MKIAISAESTIDLTNELLEKYDIKVVPFSVTLGDKTYLDGQITSSEIIKYVEETNILPKTSAVNVYQFENHFETLLKDYDAIIHFSLSSEMSSAYNNAVTASEGKDNIFVVDTRVLSTGIALLAIYASKLAKQGVEPKEIYERVQKRIPNDQTSFVLSRLDYLYKGGRCSGLKFLAATLLKIRPQIVVENGSMSPRKKYLGKFSKAIMKYVEDTLETHNTPDLEEAFITYTTASPEDVLTIRNILLERGFKNVNITLAGGTVTSHCGENCLGILYLNDGDENGEYKG